MPEPAPRSSKAPSKAEQTRATIVTSALDLFRTKGFDGTTMRGIADAAGVSLGSAYYYFAGKEHLIQAFYGQMQEDHLAAVGDVLDSSTDFADRLRGVLEAWVTVAEPYHEFAGTFFKNAAEPTQPAVAVLAGVGGGARREHRALRVGPSPARTSRSLRR